VMDQIRYLEAKTRTVDGTNGVSYAYRRVGPDGGRPLVLLQHFRGNLENWDPDLIDALSASRDVVVFDNTGVGATTGSTPTTIAQMADDAIVFVEALGLTEIDLLGFSIGSFVAQELVLTRRSLVVKLILASTAPQGAPGMHGWAPDIITAIGEPTTDTEGFLHGFFTDSAASRAAGTRFLDRIFSRTEDRDEQTILPWYSHLTASLLPDALVKLYPDAAHGFLFQHAQAFANDVGDFLV
jgi:pimeloyl-ACP methyl ester carboxylesterase